MNLLRHWIKPPWSSRFPKEKRSRAVIRYLPRSIRCRLAPVLPLNSVERYENRYQGKRCFILGNGPSLFRRDLSALKNEITFGANGLFRKFDQLGFQTTFFSNVDITQAEDWGEELGRLKGFTKFVALKNSFAYPFSPETVVLNSCEQKKEDRLNPKFSCDASRLVYHCKTVTFIALQLAYYMGFERVYLVGVDHNYGPIAKMFPPGKIEVTAENIELINQAHFSPGYYKIGDRLGIPDYAMIEAGYGIARDAFSKDGRMVFNATDGGLLEVFERKRLDDILTGLV